MLNLNKNKLIPATEIIAYWGEIKGDISKQTDLVELTTDLDTSIKGWVSEQGYLTEHQDLSSYALKSEIPSLNGYATENWVESKGYVTAETLPEGIATESWVQSQGYISDPNNDLVPLFNKQNGYLKYEPALIVESMSNKMLSVPKIDATNVNILCNNIGDNVYLFNPLRNKFFGFNFETFKFDSYKFISSEMPSGMYPMWVDSWNIVHYGNSYILNIDDNLRTVGIENQDLGGDFQYHSGSMKSNIIKKDGVVYMISLNNNCAYIFNEETQYFDSSIPVRGTFPSNTFYRYLSEFEGHWIYDEGKEQTELVFHLDEAEPYVEWVTLPERLFPGAWSYEYEGKTINETTRGVFVHPVINNGVTEYYNFGYKNPVMYKLVNGAWEIVGYNQNVYGMKTTAAGCTYNGFWFGYGYITGNKDEIIIWNMYPYEAGRSEFYGWYDLNSDIEGINSKIDDTNIYVNTIYSKMDSIVIELSNNIEGLNLRVSTLETNYGDALNITNQILG